MNVKVTDYIKMHLTSEGRFFAERKDGTVDEVSYEMHGEINSFFRLWSAVRYIENERRIHQR